MATALSGSARTASSKSPRLACAWSGSMPVVSWNGIGARADVGEHEHSEQRLRLRCAGAFARRAQRLRAPARRHRARPQQPRVVEANRHLHVLEIERDRPARLDVVANAEDALSERDEVRVRLPVRRASARTRRARRPRAASSASCERRPRAAQSARRARAGPHAPAKPSSRLHVLVLHSSRGPQSSCAASATATTQRDRDERPRKRRVVARLRAGLQRARAHDRRSAARRLKSATSWPLG